MKIHNNVGCQALTRCLQAKHCHLCRSKLSFRPRSTKHGHCEVAQNLLDKLQEDGQPLDCLNRDSTTHQIHLLASDRWEIQV